MSRTVYIVRAGIGGLMAGALLVKEGYQVTVLEKATRVGGSAGSYVRNKRIFPAVTPIHFKHFELTK